MRCTSGAESYQASRAIIAFRPPALHACSPSSRSCVPSTDSGFIFNATGLVDTVAGAWEDLPPGPPGKGILACVEFITAESGTGASPITVTGESTTSSVPESAALVLFASGLALVGVRRTTTRQWSEYPARPA